MKGIMEILERIVAWMMGWKNWLCKKGKGLWGSVNSLAIRVRCYGMVAEPGIDGILVTVGLCIIALLLCVVMKNSLSDFIKSIVASMTKEATDILSGTRV